MTYFIRELLEEAEDFFEDIGEDIFRLNRRHPRRSRQVLIGGIETTVRPAYLFAERVDNLLKLIFAVSIIISGITASFFGFIKLSDLLEVLIFTAWGRILMIFIGVCYMLTALWKLAEIKVKSA
ncbi:MAG: hypothetical protein K0S20_126 [Patescibacteria group bacterium]|jgi:hypothetical protein|nr:hypothetical protein [Patescibacteria group bacterium]